MDELAAAAGADPLEFRLANLTTRRRDVLEKAAQEFDWTKNSPPREPNRGVGLACGTEKGSFVAACVEIAIDRHEGNQVRRVCEAFECGKILNPENLLTQVQGAIIMGLGPALREEMQFDQNGKILNATFRRYRVPRFADVPAIDSTSSTGPTSPRPAPAKPQSSQSPRPSRMPSSTPRVSEFARCRSNWRDNLRRIYILRRRDGKRSEPY